MPQVTVTATVTVAPQPAAPEAPAPAAAPAVPAVEQPQAPAAPAALGVSTHRSWWQTIFSLFGKN